MKKHLFFLLIIIISSSFVFGQNFANLQINSITKGSQNTDGGNSITVFDDNVYLLWQDMDSTFFTYISKSTDGGLTFNDGVKIGSDEPHVFGSISSNAAGVIYTSWDGINSAGDALEGIYFSKSVDEAESFSTPLEISNTGLFPQIASNGDNVYIVYLDAKYDSTFGYFFTRSTNGGDSFDTPYEITTGTFEHIKFDSPHSVIVDNVGNIYCTWNDGRRDSVGTDIYFAKSSNNGISFNTNIMINDELGSISKIRTGSHIAADGDNIYCVWRQEDDNNATNRKIYFSKSNDGGLTFGAEIELASEGWDSPDIFLSPSKNIYVTFPNNFGSYEGLVCVASQDGGETFSNTVTLSNSNQHTKNPSILVDDNETLYSVWTVAGENNEDDVYFAKGNILFTPSPVTTSNKYLETFDNAEDIGWAFLASHADISVNSGFLNLVTTSDDYIHMILPIGATKDDFSFRTVGGEASGIDGGGIGRMGFKSLVYMYIDGDSISIMYTDDIQSYSEPNLSVLYTAPFIQTNKLQLDGIRSGNNLVINAYMDDILFYSGQIYNADEGLFSGQMFIDISKNEGETLTWAVDEVEVNYNPLHTAVSFTDDFSDSNSPWFRLGDWDNVGESVTIANGRLNFNYNDVSTTALYLIPPTGSVKDFSIELQGGAEADHNADFGISRFYDFKNYVSMILEGDSVYIGYALNNDGDIEIIESAQFNASSDAVLKFSVEENSSNLTLNVWADNSLVLTGDITNAPEILKSGHVVLGFDGSIADSYIDYATLNFTRLLTDINEKPIASVSTYQLYQNYPNPFNPSTTIQYQIPQTDNVSLKIYDILGNEIAVLVNETKTSGIHNVVINSKALSSGIYFYRLQSSSYSETKKLLLIK